MVEPLDPILVALAGCPVVQQEEEGGYITFNPYPVISASSSLILSHEICHKLSGPDQYNKFATACHVRQDPSFKFILNMLTDWWDESKNSQRSMYLHRKVQALKNTVKIDYSLPTPILDLVNLYVNNIEPDYFPDEITCIEDLIILADRFLESLKPDDLEIIKLFSGCSGGDKKGKGQKIGQKMLGGGAGSDLVPTIVKANNFYMRTISKYHNIIETVCTLWLRNKYKWESAYFGEINWKRLVDLIPGDMLGQPIYRLFKKTDIARRVFLVVDRSGSTANIKTPIMETAIIIAESFKRCKVPVSILDVGHTDTIINSIDEPLKLDWFIPLSCGGTPLGTVCAMIKESTPDDYLLIITDGQPDSWPELKKSLAKFKGYNLGFIIGNTFREYFQNLNGNAISVEPTTIIRELINDTTLAS